MNVDSWEEACKWAWGSSDGFDKFHLKIIDDIVYYQYLDAALKDASNGDWFSWMTASTENLSFLEHYKRTPNIEFLGPHLSEAPPLIRKIRLMEQRHKRYMERKYCD